LPKLSLKIIEIFSCLIYIGGGGIWYMRLMPGAILEEMIISLSGFA
jgi:hypothetical protein